MFPVLLVVRVSLVYSCIKTYQIIYFKLCSVYYESVIQQRLALGHILEETVLSQDSKSSIQCQGLIRQGVSGTRFAVVMKIVCPLVLITCLTLLIFPDLFVTYYLVTYYLVARVFLVMVSRTCIYSDDFSLMPLESLHGNQEAVGLVASGQICTVSRLEDPCFP